MFLAGLELRELPASCCLNDEIKALVSCLARYILTWKATLVVTPSHQNPALSLLLINAFVPSQGRLGKTKTKKSKQYKSWGLHKAMWLN